MAIKVKTLDRWNLQSGMLFTAAMSPERAGIRDLIMHTTTSNRPEINNRPQHLNKSGCENVCLK